MDNFSINFGFVCNYDGSIGRISIQWKLFPLERGLSRFKKHWMEAMERLLLNPGIAGSSPAEHIIKDLNVE